VDHTVLSGSSNIKPDERSGLNYLNDMLDESGKYSYCQDGGTGLEYVAQLETEPRPRRCSALSGLVMVGQMS
jgi:hypothetical protein